MINALIMSQWKLWNSSCPARAGSSSDRHTCGNGQMPDSASLFNSGASVTPRASVCV